MLNKDEKKKLKEKLPHNWASILSDRCKLSKSYIFKVMNGDKRSLLIENKALELAEEQEKTKLAIEQLRTKI